MSVSAVADTPEERFEMKVRPILARNCFACHTASKMGGLAMTSREALLKGGKGGPVIVEGQPDQSRLIHAVRQADDSVKAMPPMGKLKPEEIAALEEWVRDGAVWPERAKVQAQAAAISPEQRAFWSFQPVRRVAPPAAQNAEWSHSPIDQFIYTKLREKGLTPAPRAEKRVWIRRVTFDLTGLPPTPEEVHQFLNDHSPKAEAKVVDRLLASPRYGERWARHWLDVARYSDDRLESQKELVHPNAFRYRDWVIQAFNDDMPFDRFVMAQIAADQMPEPDRAKLLPGLTFYGLSPEQQDERVDATTRGFLGLTVACAQCHDHKFDPIPQADFYSLQGVFNNTVVDEVPLAAADVVERWKAHKKRLDDKEAELKTFQEEQAISVAAMLAARTADYVRAVLGEGEAKDLDPETLEHWRTYLKPGMHEHPFLDNWKDADKFQELVLSVLAEKKEIDQKNLIRLGGSSQRNDLSSTELLSLDRPKFRFYNEVFGTRKSVLYYSGDKLEPLAGRSPSRASDPAPVRCGGHQEVVARTVSVPACGKGCREAEERPHSDSRQQGQSGRGGLTALPVHSQRQRTEGIFSGQWPPGTGARHRQPQQSSDAAGDGQPHLAAPLWNRHRGHAQQLRPTGRAADASGTA
ncbi:MAG: DUF1549 domain-containing protein [Paludibaculum sp.]